LVPNGNPTSTDVRSVGGCVATPTTAGAREAAAWIAQTTRDPEELILLGKRARAFAEDSFDIEKITDEFEAIVHEAAGRASNTDGAPQLAVLHGGSEGTSS
ncbi:MAG: hypothetical protein ABI368_02990, partial [Jatrophihabitantaceae bacterium]